uniref:Uncharacterized protein n=1 Tax=Romanomermis culicivorax TaxID=13658 RepID=A0A915J2L0_ROMCU
MVRLEPNRQKLEQDNATSDLHKREEGFGADHDLTLRSPPPPPQPRPPPKLNCRSLQCNLDSADEPFRSESIAGTCVVVFLSPDEQGATLTTGKQAKAKSSAKLESIFRLVYGTFE